MRVFCPRIPRNLQVLRHSPKAISQSYHNLSRHTVFTRAMSSEISQPASSHENSTQKLRFVDIGINLSDPMFRGRYHGKSAHQDDLNAVVARARSIGVDKMMVTGSSLEDSKAAIEVAQQFPSVCYATVGIHPCSALTIPQSEPSIREHMKQLADLALSHPTVVTAWGEIGLDYDRLNYASVETQLQAFELQLDAAIEHNINLPLFLHMRAAADDFVSILKPRLAKLPKKGLVHSFTGTKEEMRQMIDLGLDVGVNGCSLKTEENLEVVRELPLECLQIETDGPWCEIRPSHAGYKFLSDAPPQPKAVKKERWVDGSMVKGRNEPVAIIQVAHIIAKVKGISVEEVSEAAWNNSIRMFGLGTA